MIPRTEVELDSQLPASATFWTPKREDLSEEGFGYFRGAWLIHGVRAREARELIETEATLASLAAELAQSAEEFDDLAAALETGMGDALPDRLSQRDAFARISPHLDEDDDGFAPLDGLELGVAGLVYALSSVRCWPAASCRGHPGPHAWSDAPVVLFAADERRARTLVPLVQLARCGFAIDQARPDLLVVEAPSIEETMALARLIMGHAKAFAPEPKARVDRAPRVRSAADQLSLALGDASAE